MAYVTSPTFIIFGLFYICEMSNAKDFKFGVLIDRRTWKPKNEK